MATASSRESSPKGQRLIRIYQETEQVLRSGLLYLGKDTAPNKQDSETKALEEAIAELSAQEIGERIIKEAAAYSSRADARHLNILSSRYMALQDQTAMELLESGLVTVTRRKETPEYALADLTGEEPEAIAGPVTGIADEAHASLGWFNLVAEEARLCTVQGISLVDIHIEA